MKSSKVSAKNMNEAYDIASKAIDFIVEAETGTDGWGNTCVTEVGAQHIIDALVGSKDAFLLLDEKSHTVPTRFSWGAWFWKLRQVRNKYPNRLFASFKQS